MAAELEAVNVTESSFEAVDTEDAASVLGDANKTEREGKQFWPMMHRCNTNMNTYILLAYPKTAKKMFVMMFFICLKSPKINSEKGVNSPSVAVQKTGSG
jgi:hypothetical protein